MAKLPSRHHDLSPVVALMRHEIGQHVPHVQRQVAPDIGLRGGNLSACRDAEFEKFLDTPAAPLQGGEQAAARYPPKIDERGYGKSVLVAESPEPPAPGVVEMGGNRAKCASWYPGNRGVPQHGWKLLHEVGSHEAVRPPRGEDGWPEIGDRAHSLVNLTLMPTPRECANGHGQST